MATPHTVGVVALYLALGITDIANAIKDDATRGAIKQLKKGTLNLLIYNQPTPADPSDPIPTPTETEPACEKPWYCDYIPTAPECQC